MSALSALSASLLGSDLETSTEKKAKSEVTCFSSVVAKSKEVPQELVISSCSSLVIVVVLVNIKYSIKYE